MADLPFPLSSEDIAELKPQVVDIMRDIYENRIGGAILGDVFRMDGDTFELKIKSGCGLIKTDGGLDFDKSVIGTTATDITNTPSGNISSSTVQGAINELDTEKVSVGNAIGVFKYLLLKAMPRPSGEAGYSIIYMDESDSKLYVVWPDSTRTQMAP